MTLRLAWFATGRGQMSGKLLAAAREAIDTGRLDAEIAVVFCNRAPGEDPNTDALQKQVRESGVPLVTLSSRDFRKRVGGAVARKGEALPEWRRQFDRGEPGVRVRHQQEQPRAVLREHSAQHRRARLGRRAPRRQ